MPVIKQRMPWTSQSQAPVGVNFGNPIVREPLLLEVGGNPIDLVRGKLGVKNNPTSESLITTSYGKATSFTGNTVAGHLYSGGSTSAITQITFAGVFTWISGAANNYPQLCGTSTANNGMRISSSAASGGDISLVKGGVAGLTPLAISSGVPYVYICSHDQGTGEYYILAKSLTTGIITSVTQTNTSVSSSPNGTYSVGIARTDFSGAWNGSIGLCYIGRSFVHQSVGRTFLDNPWQILAP